MSHTPGPWLTDIENPVTDIKATGFLEVLDDANGTLAFVNCESMPPSKEDFANARLIAAAPELLAAVEDLLDVLDMETDAQKEVSEQTQEVLDAAYAAIAKAKGGQACGT